MVNIAIVIYIVNFFFHCHFEFQFVCNGNAYKFYSYYMNNVSCVCDWREGKNEEQARIFKALFNSDSPLFELAFDILPNNFVSSSFSVHIFHSNDPSSFQQMRGKSARNSTTNGKESNVHCTSHLHEQKYKGKYCVAVSFAMILSFFLYALFVKRIIFSFQIHFAWIMDVSRCVRASFHSNWSGRVHTFFSGFLFRSTVFTDLPSNGYFGLSRLNILRT